MYENLGTYMFTNGTKRKRSVTKILYVAIWTSIRECISSFSRFIYGICDFKLDYQYVSETTRFICEMIVDNSV